MVTETEFDINPCSLAADVSDWAMSLDAFLDTSEGQAWLSQMAEAHDLAESAFTYGVRPGLED